MKRPKMILFDYGQTLISQAKFDGVKGTEAVLSYAVKNRWNRTAAQVQQEAIKINQELNRNDPAFRYQNEIEVHNYPFQNYLYESQGIELSISNEEIESVFWENAAPGTAVEGIQELLTYLNKEGIRTGVISNLSFSQKALTKAQLDVEDVWYCGDDLQCDVVRAYNAGMTPVWFTGALDMNQKSVDVKYLTMPSWKQFIDYLEQIGEKYDAAAK